MRIVAALHHTNARACHTDACEMRLTCNLLPVRNLMAQLHVVECRLLHLENYRRFSLIQPFLMIDAHSVISVEWQSHTTCTERVARNDAAAVSSDQ